MSRINLGIAGYMGSGKSVCAGYLSRFGGSLIEADAVAKEVMNTDTEIKDRLIAHFGGDIVRDDAIQYTVLGTVAFQSMANLLQLNAIVHPPLLLSLQKVLAETQGQLCIIDAALIPLWHIEDWFDGLLWIDAPAGLRAKRVLKKGVLGEAELQNRMTLQEGLFSEPKGKNWITVKNSGTKSEFETAITETMSDNFSSVLP